MPKRVVVIGTGPGGYVAAIRAAQLGAEVIAIEKEFVGGVCLNVGCIPTKALLASAELLRRIKDAKSMGIEIKGISFDLEKIVARKEKVISTLRNGIEALFKSWGITLVKGEGRLNSEREVLVIKADGSQEKIQADAIIIAVGSRPAMPKIFPYDGEAVLNSSNLLSPDEIPESLLIVGAGAIGVEFATMYSTFGSKVSIVEMLPRLLPTADEEISQALARYFKRQGIDVYTGEAIKSMEVSGGEVIAHLSSGETIKARKALIAVGRTPNTENLGLEEVGVDKDERGFIKVDEYLRTSIPNIYAIGDAIGGILLAHKASYDGKVASENIFDAERQVNYKSIPSCVFTYPEVAWVGMTESQAREAGYDVVVEKFQYRALGKSHAIGEIEGFIKIVADSKYGEILGVHIIGHSATDLIAEAGLAISLEATLEDVAHTIHAHPTLPELFAEVCEAALGAAIHIPKKK